MSKGVVLFALNNKEINYIKLAEFVANRIDSFLKVPVSVITDSASAKLIQNSSLFDKVILIENDTQYFSKTFRDGVERKKDLWKNSHRHTVYELSPYEETLVIDVDYVINSDILNYCWDQPHDFLIYKQSHDLASWRTSEDYAYISQYSIPFYWATVFFFRKTPANKIFFSLLLHVKENWDYYNFLYQLSSPNFRNDFAFSIVIHLMNGKTNGDFAKFFPSKLYYTLDFDILHKLKNKSLFLLMNKNFDKFVPAKVSGIDVHVMNKFSLLRVLEK